MTFDEYQAFTAEVAIYPYAGEGAYEYPLLGLAGEVGEVSSLFAKAERDGIPYDLDEKLQKELGDVLWMVARLADEFGLTLSGVAAANVAKLQSRAARGVIGGSGDNR